MRGFEHFVCASLAAAASISVTTAAFATSGQPPATAKGMVGGGFLGAEAVMLCTAAAGVRPAWAYGVGGGLGAAAGVVGGYFVEQDASPKVSLYLLVGGMTLIIPTTVAVLSTTAYEPVNYVEDCPPVDEPVAEPARTPPTVPAAAPASPSPTSHASPHGDQETEKRIAKTTRLPALPPALVGLADGNLTLSVPAVEVRHMYTRVEVATLGVKQHEEVSIPVFNAVF